VLHPFFVIFFFLKAPIFLVSFAVGVGRDLARTRKKNPKQVFRLCSLKISEMPQ